MIRIKRIGFKNLLSFGECWNYLNLDQPGVNLILGENLDVLDGDGRNGVGKTTIYNGLAIALYNHALTFIKKDNWINATNKKGMEVVAEFEKDQVDYKVHRGRKPDFVRLYRKPSYEDWDAEKHDITPDSIANTNALIEKIMGVKFSLFKYVVLFTASNIPFLDLPAADQRGIIERLFDMDIITEKALKASEKKSSLKQDVEIEEYKYNSVKKNNERINATIKNAEDRKIEWENLREKEIADIEEKLSLIEHVDFEKEEKFHDELNELRKAITALSIEKKQANDALTTSQSEIEILEGHLKHLHDEECPYCKQQMPGAGEMIGETTGKLNYLQEERAQRDTMHQDLVSDLKEKKIELEKVIEDIAHDSLTELLEIRNQAGTLREKLEDLKKGVNPHDDHVAELKKSGIQKLDSTKIDNLKKEFTHTSFLLKLLNDKNSFIRRRIVGQVLPFMNSRLKHYLKELGLPHRVEFENNLTVSISQYGRELDFGNLSTGEKQRVNLALSFTFREVLSQMHTHFSILLLDEVLDAGLDASGVDATVKILKHMGRELGTSIFLISHREEVSARVAKTIIVRKENGFSSIEETVDD